MGDVFLKIVNMSISASWLVLAVLLLRLALKRAPKWVSVLLWGFVAVRLICPVSIESVLSLIPSAETVGADIMAATPRIHTGIQVLDSAVNPVIAETFAPAPLASANPLQIWIPVFGYVWLAGVALMLLYTAVSYLTLRGKMATAVLLQENVYQSENVVTPFVLGVIRPKIYLPYHMDDRSKDYVIAHEKAHIRRKDHWWKPLGFVLLALHWFNPLLWLGYVLLCRDIELACDEKVIREMDSEAKADYTQALVSCSVHRRSIAACPLAFGEVGVKERVRSVMLYKKPTFWIVLAAVLLCVAVAVCFLTDPATSVDEKLSVFLDGQIAEHFQNEKSAGNACCVNWEVLGKEKKGDEITVYMWVLYQEYSLLNNQLHVETAVHIPTVVTAELCDSHGVYDLVEYWEPRDGSYLEEDIRGKFPRRLQNKALDSQRYIRQQREENEELAWQYLMEQRENAPLVAASGENAVPLIRISSAEDCRDWVYWLTVAMDENSLTPFDILEKGQVKLGMFAVYDAQTMESLPFNTPSGLEPQMWLFRNADPAGSYIVTVRFSDDPEGELYAFGVRFNSNAAQYGVGADRKTVGTRYVYEKGGFMGTFTVTLYSDGTFTYYEGSASSYFGLGTWTQEGDMITLTDDPLAGGGLVNRFQKKGNDLVYVSEGSTNFIYVKVKNGESFRHDGSEERENGAVGGKTGMSVAEAVSAAILSQNAGDSFLNIPTGGICVESHATLDSETISGTPTVGENEHKTETTVYVRYVYKRYYYSGGTLEDRAGTASVAAITLTGNEEAGYTVADFWEPAPGDGYAAAVLERFSKTAAEKTLDTYTDALYANDLESKCLTKAQHYVAELSGETALPVAWIFDPESETANTLRLEFDVACTGHSVNSQNGLLLDLASPTVKKISEELKLEGREVVYWTPSAEGGYTGESVITFSLYSFDVCIHTGTVTVTGSEWADGTYVYTATLDSDTLTLESNPESLGFRIREK
ncbi:MAG: hypothetical protein IKU07_04315 [Oscillospiraceae bacterium]|nr:hypothetical protein [Oscillospiraceae bacterium]